MPKIPFQKLGNNKDRLIGLEHLNTLIPLWKKIMDADDIQMSTLSDSPMTLVIDYGFIKTLQFLLFSIILYKKKRIKHVIYF